MSIDITRRQALLGLLGAGAAAGLAACTRTGDPIGAAAVASAAATRTGNGRTTSFDLRARPVTLDLGGATVTTWAYGDTAPGTALRATAGDRVTVAFTNDLPVPTSVHWHGLAIRNDMDGVPTVTTPEVPAGGRFAFDFVVPDPGTHWFHPHSGLQLDRGLYAPFIIDDPAEPGSYDHEWIVVLDDWTDGVGPSPEQILADLQSGAAGNGMGGMDMGGMGGMGGMDMGGMGMGDTPGSAMGAMGSMDGGDVAYPMFLINGRPPNDPDVLTARPGQTVRLRIINASADTIYTVSLGEHDMHVTHTDGYPVTPVTTGALKIAMGERYDATVTLDDGVFVLAALPVGKTGFARALVRTGAGAVPSTGYRPSNLTGHPLTIDAVRGDAASALPARDPDTLLDVRLAGTMNPYRWTINGRTYDQTVPLTIREGQAARLRITNHSMMPHPLHLHGHTFQVGPAGGTGPRKDTLLVPSMAAVSVDLLADNPGLWMVHCHNAYHAEAGMMTRLDYTT